MYTISILRSDNSSALFELAQPRAVIGRESGDVATFDPQLSDPHAELRFESGVLTFVDLGSANGSYLASGERVSAPVRLEPGTAVRLGGCTLTVQSIQAPAAAPAASPATASPAAPAVQAPSSAMASPAPSAPAPPAPAATAAPYGGAPSGQPSAVVPQASAAAPSGEGILDLLSWHLSAAYALYKQHFLGGVLTLGLVVVPATLLNVALGWIPVLGVIVAIVVGLAQLALTPFAVGAMGRWALAVAAGHPIGWKSAWRAALENPGQEWLNMFVAVIISTLGTVLLIVPGIIVGMFALPAYLLEDQRFIAINTRSAELVMKDPGRHLGLGLLMVLTIVPVAIVMVVLTIALAFIPVVGSPLASLISVAVYMAVLPFVYLLWSRVYYDARQRYEGVDAAAQGAPRFQHWAQR